MGLFESHVPVDSITVMVQKEVADRMQTGPGSKDYGALSLAVQYYAKPEIVANVPPNCFMPRPKVGSAVIRLTRHQNPPVQAKDEKLMFRIIRASFNQRRKTLANGLKNSQELQFTKEQVDFVWPYFLNHITDVLILQSAHCKFFIFTIHGIEYHVAYSFLKFINVIQENSYLSGDCSFSSHNASIYNKKY